MPEARGPKLLHYEKLSRCYRSHSGCCHDADLLHRCCDRADPGDHHVHNRADFALGRDRARGDDDHDNARRRLLTAPES